MIELRFKPVEVTIMTWSREMGVWGGEGSCGGRGEWGGIGELGRRGRGEVGRIGRVNNSKVELRSMIFVTGLTLSTMSIFLILLTA